MAIRDFIAKVKISESGHVTASEAEQTKLLHTITDLLEAANHEGKRIATGKEERGLISAAKNLAGRAVKIAGGIMNQIRDKVRSLYDPNLPNPYAGLDISDWAEGYSEMVAATEITDAIEEAVYDDFVEQGTAIVSWVAEDGACEECLANAEASPLPISSPFPSGDYHPPAHPNCRCNLERDVVLEDSQ
jgi:hypothetical protein